MGFQNFPKINSWVVASTNETFDFVKFQLVEATELYRIKLTLLKIGTHSTESFVGKIFTNSRTTDGTSTKIAQSETVLISDLSGITSSNWMGSVYLNFDRVWLSPNIVYYLQIVMSNYTRSGDTKYIGFKCDWPDQINTGPYTAGQIGILGYR